MKKIDLALLGITLASVAVIGYRLVTAPDGETDPVKTTDESTLPAPVQVAKPSSVDSSITAFRGPYWILGRLKKLSDTEWQSALSVATAFSTRSNISDGCRGETGTSRTYVNHTVREYAERMGRAQYNVLLGLGNEICHKTGDILSVLSFDPSMDRPLVEHLGFIKIKEIFMIKPSAVTTSFLAKVGLTREEYLEYLYTVGRRTDQPDTLLKFEESTSSLPNLNIAPPSFPNTKILSYAESRKLAEAGSAIIVDVRPAEQFGRAAFANHLNIPVSFNQSQSPTTRFTAKKSEFGRADFQIASLLGMNLDSKTVIVLGSGPADVRPLFALYELSASGVQRLAWAYEGVQGTN